MHDTMDGTPPDDSAIPVVTRADASTRNRRKRLHRALRAVRKIHMYVGLVLFPWVVFFGLTGMLFNHPGVGEQTSGRPLPKAELEAAGIHAVAPAAVAESIAAALRAQGKSFRLDPSYDSGFHGTTGVASSAPGVKLLTIVDLERGRGVVLTRPDHATADAPFAGELPLEQVQLETLPATVTGLLAGKGITSSEPYLAMAQVLRFRLLDDAGRPWNATYDLGSGRLDGRPTDSPPPLSLHDLLGAMHKTHHFPARVGPTLFWVLFADLTALALVIWALTGIVMWVQIKKSRALGVVAVSVGVLLATVIMLWTDAELRFGHVRPSEPGDRRPTGP
jgi:hypothetical protein